MIQCRTLGPLRITIDGEDAPKELLWKKNTALVVYLARSPGRTRTREHLCGLLWPEKPEASARHSLNEALRNIRRAGGDDTLISDARSVGVANGAVELDVDALAAALSSEDGEGAGKLVGGHFMDGFGVPDCSELEDWLSFERREWQAASVRALTGWAESLLESGDLVRGEEVARRAQALDPLSDLAAQSVVRAAALRGDRGEALGHYDDFAAVLREQLGAEPAPETTRLADRVRRERTWRLPDAVAQQEGAHRLGLIGRADHMSRASEAWRDCQALERAGMLLIEGESGAGKTRLVEAIAARARLDGAAVLGVRAVPADREIPGAAVVALAEGGLADSAGALDCSAGAVATLCSVSTVWRDRFGDEFGEEADRPLARAFCDVVVSVAAQQPVVLMVDDAEWLDDLSRETLELAVRDLGDTAALVTLSGEGEAGREVLDRFESGAETDQPLARIAVTRWADDELVELVGAVMPEYDDEQRARLARRISADSGGIPLLAVELAEAVRDGLDVGEEGPSAWPRAAQTLEQTMPSDLPGGVRSAIRVNFRRFSEAAQVVVGAATVLPERFGVADLEGVVEIPVADIEQALDELERRRWVESDPRGYSFVARIVKEIVAEDMLTPGQRRRLAERAGNP